MDDRPVTAMEEGSTLAARSKKSEKYPVSNLDFLYREHKLKLDPEYQRGPVWKASQKQLLIDSLLQGFDVPKLYFRQVDDPIYKFEVVDGQQRLRSIIEFLDGGFKIKDDADPVDGFVVGGLRFSELDVTLQMLFRQINLDLIELIDYSQEDVEDMFLRLQNGTTLHAAEKRKSIPGNMRAVVKTLSAHKAFKLAAFPAAHDGYQDAVAKALHQLLAGGVTDIRPTSLENTYRNHPSITVDDPQVKRLKQAMAFLVTAFKDRTNPQLKKYAYITLGVLLPELLDTYDLSKHAAEFADVYLKFQDDRVKNEEKPENKQDSALAAFTDAARSDTIPAMKYRYEYLRDRIAADIPSLAARDRNRTFSPEQRMAIFRRDKGICQAPGCKTVCDESDFHADHIVPHSKGGPTSVENGRVLCPKHNLTLGDREDY